MSKHDRTEGTEPSEDELVIPSALADDLAAAFAPSRAVAEDVDRDVLEAARAQLEPTSELPTARPAGPSESRNRSRLAWLAPVAAAAAWLLWFALRSGPLPGDADGNGRLDVRDAMRIARGLRDELDGSDPGGAPGAPGAPGKSARWDANGDGRVDEADVEHVMATIVRIPS